MSAPSINSGPALSGPTQGSGDLGDLILQVQDLRQRVLNLEERLGTVVAAPEVPVPVPVPLLPTGFDLPPNIVPSQGSSLLLRQFNAFANASNHRGWENSIRTCSYSSIRGFAVAPVGKLRAARRGMVAHHELLVECIRAGSDSVR